jgi:adenylate kinase
MSNVSSRVQNRSHSQHQRDTIREISEKQERELVTNYMRKIEQSESRVLMKEIDNERRIQTSKNSRVKCLVEQRNRM